MNLTFRKPIFLFICLFCWTSLSFSQIFEDDQDGRTLALVIGISDYKYETDLKFADKDAEDFAAFLRSEDGMNLPPENFKIYTNDRATQASILYEGLNWLSEELQPGDQAFIFYSGHGEIANIDANLDVLKTGYLLTYESQRDKYETTALKMEDFLRNFHMMAAAKQATVRVIMDVCHAGIGMKSGGIINMMEMAGQYNPQKQIVFTSCHYDQKSYEYDALQNGVFTYFLIQGLKGAADGATVPSRKDDIITFDEIKAYTKKNVTRYVEHRNNTLQEPNFKGDNKHSLSYTLEAYEAPDLSRLFTDQTDEQGNSKSLDPNSPALAQTMEDLERGGLSNKKIQEAHQLYQDYIQQNKMDATVERDLKRGLIAAMIEKADGALTTYFRNEKELSKRSDNSMLADYYLQAARLMGHAHFQYKESLAKFYFLKAMELRSKDIFDRQALDCLWTAHTLAPNASFIFNELGSIFYDKKNYEKALAYYERAAAISPTWAKNVIKVKNHISKYTGEKNSPDAYEEVPRITPEDKIKNDQHAPLVYHIQLAASGTVNRDRFQDIQHLGSINPVYDPVKNVISSRMGPYESKEQAQSVLAEVQRKGFKDAFLRTATAESKFAERLDKKQTEIKQDLATNLPYQIRLAAVQNFRPEDFVAVESFGNVTAIPTEHADKQLFRVFIPAADKQSALNILAKVKKAGFPEAYLYTNDQRSLSSTSKQVPAAYDNIDNNTSYRIRAASVSKLMPSQLEKLEKLGPAYIEVTDAPHRIRIYFGDYKERAAVDRALQKIKIKGYSDAFIQQVK